MGLRLDIRPEEISNIIKNQIKNYENKAEEAETGTVITCETALFARSVLTTAWRMSLSFLKAARKAWR